MLQEPASLPDLASTYRELYRTRFHADVRAGTTTPFVVPLHLVAYWVVPTFYLAIPHRNRPWLYHAKWLVIAFVCAFDWYMIKNVASQNFASSYGAGLLAAWATIWNFTLLVWTKPQWDARRVERRRVSRPIHQTGSSQQRTRLPIVTGQGQSSKSDTEETSGSVSILTGPREIALDPRLNSVASVAKTTATHDKVNGTGEMGASSEQLMASLEIIEAIEDEPEEKLLARDIIALNDNGNDENLRLDQKTVLQFIRLARENEYEYYWQEYPADASFWTRLDWAFDLVSSFRLTGWNWAPSCLPPYGVPPGIGQYQLPLEYGSHTSKQGYKRTLSRRRLILSRLFLNFIPSYIAIDLLAAVITADPYFIVGPEHDHPLPPYLASLHPVLLSLQRTILGFVAVVIALQYAWNAGAIFLALCCPPILGFRAHPWHLPSLFGSFTQVLDHGLSGFWGAWWHQSFRVGFSAPTKWLLRHGYLPSPRPKTGGGRQSTALVTPLAGAVIAFAQSALIHGAGSYSSVPTTHYWGPPTFFALSCLGTLLQSVCSHQLRRRIERFPRWVRRLGNFSFVFLWLWATSWTLCKSSPSADGVI
ncbi:hypothetical protein F5Y14DRAFT_446608 [Nemania sp. NC0429]|nr:hypothetical protein F5Y14DRAFT_446608 [Nemania sp. NC0429]